MKTCDNCAYREYCITQHDLPSQACAGYKDGTILEPSYVTAPLTSFGEATLTLGTAFERAGIIWRKDNVR